MTLQLDRGGAMLIAGAARPLIEPLERLARVVPHSRAGVRLHDHAELAKLVRSDGPITSAARRMLGAEARPVRAILFDKSTTANWALGWHQDRTICVTEQFDVPGFGPWTRKSGLLHVEPPFEVIAAMLTMRIHLDPVDNDNAPLLIAPGSHRLGRIKETDVSATVARCGTTTCLADAGDIWLYATPILHASAASRSERRRRVLHLDYTAASLPRPLTWLGLGSR